MVLKRMKRKKQGIKEELKKLRDDMNMLKCILNLSHYECLEPDMSN